ncbi:MULTISPECIES: aromatic acid exporter family protein [Paenibacillus]|uniref:Aromatic acid exporter family protein n=1 Tax=Paenibacillus validus TaxID=44253 RepID=A0A7X2ZGP8_9BACL|nr:MULTISPECIES: aromatic acid exporter family protein [Paenibacillus]MUG73861.1 aromatic acid exporter family protein [Paenibacillus validus]
MGIRVIKTALAVILSIYIAQYLGLSSPLSTGLLAIMGVEVTKKRGIALSLQRIAASVFALLFSVALFWTLGYQVWVIGLYVLTLYPLLSRLKLKDGIVSSSVVMFHVFAAKTVTLELIVNEVLLLVIGLGTATLINIVYMPKEHTQLVQYRKQVEELFSRIFIELSRHLRDNTYVWSGRELLEAEELLHKAVDAARRQSDNRLIFEGAEWTVYFYMRERQLEAIGRMTEHVARVYQTLPHGELLATVFETLSEDVLMPHYTGRTERHLFELEQSFKGMALPLTREEFEIRAALLQLVEELKVYLNVAKKEKRPVGV